MRSSADQQNGYFHPSQSRTPRGRWRGRGRGRGAAPSQHIAHPQQGVAPLKSGRNFEIIASVSRSSGLEKDGDALKDSGVQEEYWVFIQGKLDRYWKDYPPQGPRRNTDGEQHRTDMEGNILIQLRKLREGIYASKRTDNFAVKVYEVSLHLGIIFNSLVHVPPIASYLLDSYCSAGTDMSPWTPVLVLLHDLHIHAPSQKAFYETRKQYSRSFHLEERLAVWIGGIARSLHRCDFFRFNELSHLDTVKPLLPSTPQLGSPGPDMRILALNALLGELRDRARSTSWSIFRSAYREFEPMPRQWLSRWLLFDTDPDLNQEELDSWLHASETKGEIGKKSGTEDRWVVKIKR